jgi:hypothetical protein
MCDADFNSRRGFRFTAKQGAFDLASKPLQAGPSKQLRISMAAKPARASRGVSPAQSATLRRLHAYIGAFIAPSVLFFAVTGALQLFSLHEAHGGYVPPPLIEKLSAVHKDQRFGGEHHDDGPPPAVGGARAAAPDHEDPGHNHPKTLPARTVALKWLFLAVDIGLMSSTLIGIWMALTFTRGKGVIWALLILGAALPVLILAL